MRLTNEDVQELMADLQDALSITSEDGRTTYFETERSAAALERFGEMYHDTIDNMAYRLTATRDDMTKEEAYGVCAEHMLLVLRTMPTGDARNIGGKVYRAAQLRALNALQGEKLISAHGRRIREYGGLLARYEHMPSPATTAYQAILSGTAVTPLTAELFLDIHRSVSTSSDWTDPAAWREDEEGNVDQDSLTTPDGLMESRRGVFEGGEPDPRIDQLPAALTKMGDRLGVMTELVVRLSFGFTDGMPPHVTERMAELGLKHGVPMDVRSIGEVIGRGKSAVAERLKIGKALIAAEVGAVETPVKAPRKRTQRRTAPTPYCPSPFGPVTSYHITETLAAWDGTCAHCRGELRRTRPETEVRDVSVRRGGVWHHLGEMRVWLSVENEPDVIRLPGESRWAHLRCRNLAYAKV